VTPHRKELIEDIVAASAAYLWNVLPSSAPLPAPEAFARFQAHFESAFAAYFEASGIRLPEPSEN